MLNSLLIVVEWLLDIRPGLAESKKNENSEGRNRVTPESITSEFNVANAKLATEGAARNNIVQGLAKISRLNL
jgi:hypothetical protein